MSVVTRSIVATSRVLSRDESQAVVQRALSFSKAESAQITLTSSHAGNTRFGANQVSTAGGILDASLAVQSAFGAKHAIATTNDLSDESLRRTVAQSEALARLAPDDPESMPNLGAQTYVPVSAYFESTAALTPADRARAALSALEPARAAGDLNVAGFIVVSQSSIALGNGTGLFAYYNATNANYTVTARTSDGTGSGWAGADHADWTQIDARAVSARAIEKARRSRTPSAIEPGRYTVILEPQAVGDLVQLIAFYADARSSDEGRGAFVKPGGGNKIGEKIVDSRVTLISDPADPQLNGQPFDYEGLPLGRQTWIESGVLKQLTYSRFWAKKQGKAATGAPTSVKMLGGSTSMEEMIASTPRGILVTRLWYLREVDPRTILYTGLTRDGTFLIENGKISKAITNLRFNESPLFMLNNVEAIGPSMRLAGTEAGGDVAMPALKVRDFTFTSLSEAV
ncbi:MAG: TldD/PmbA family protein [Candidatus Eremiobacteraeota bacterium]|nr:TldD/PmbA family protein [Candidatus Eremiobacteraeota bacterium]